ncbi:MAG: thioredoxin family protein [Candidatus Izemoplasmataceae bacterium]
MNKSKHPTILYILIGLLVFAAAIGPIYNAFSDDAHEHAFDYNDISGMGQDGFEVLYRYHPDCGVCQSIAADVDDFEDDNAQEIPFHRVHIDHEENLPDGLETGVPTVLVIKDGSIVDEFVGGDEVPRFFDDVNDGSYAAD